MAMFFFTYACVGLTEGEINKAMRKRFFRLKSGVLVYAEDESV